MAQHGGRTLPLARPHGSPATSAPLATTIPNNNIPNNTPVTLQAPRPSADRAGNEYVETPFKVTCVRPPARPPRPNRLPLTHTPASVTITKQPVAFTKQHCPNTTTTTGNIMCRECGKCRCASCQQPRALPERWVCDNSCLCSAESLIDYVSCLCCVKGLYYHCSETDVGHASCADDPCSCAPSARAARWGCLAALAAVLPCLLCYWPLRACQRAVEAAYARHSRQGCSCPETRHKPTPEKRLLDSGSPDF